MTPEEEELRAIRDSLRTALEKLDAAIKAKEAERQHQAMTRVHGEVGDEVDQQRLRARER